MGCRVRGRCRYRSTVGVRGLLAWGSPMSAAEFADYIKIDAVNWSTLKHMRTSPLHYRHAVDSPDEDTARFGIGRAIHTAILEPHKLATDYAVFDGKRRAGKKWKTFEAENVTRT